MSLPVMFTPGKPKIKIHIPNPPLETIREAKLPTTINIDGYDYTLTSGSIEPSSNKHNTIITGIYDSEDSSKTAIIREDGSIIASYNLVSGTISVLAFLGYIVDSGDVYMLYGQELAEPGPQCIDSINLRTGEVKHSITCFDMSSGNTREVWSYYNGRPALGYPDKLIVYIKDSSGNIIDTAMIDKDGRTSIDVNPKEVLSSCGISEESNRFVTHINGEYYIPYSYSIYTTIYTGLITPDCSKYDNPGASVAYAIWGFPGVEDYVKFRGYVVRPDGVLFNSTSGIYGVLYNGVVLGIPDPIFSIFDYDYGKPVIGLDNGGLSNMYIGIYAVDTSWIKNRWTVEIKWPFFE